MSDAPQAPLDDPARADPADVVDLEVVEDRTAGSRADEGFLRVRRLVLRSVRRDGTRSEPFACDVVSRARTDAVAVAVYEIVPAAPGGPGARRRGLRVLLKTGVRPPVWLRRRATLTQPDDRGFLLVPEVVAGMLEAEDGGPRGIERRASAECREEAGLAVDPDDVASLGGPTFPSPGITDEKVHFRAVRAPLERRTTPEGDGSVMEEGGRVLVLPVEEAIAACRRGDVPDMKTELALLRLCDAVGYVPALSCFVDELPAELARRWRPLGLEGGR